MAADFALAGFEVIELIRVHESADVSLEAFRDRMVLMRHTDSLLTPLSDDEFAEGLVAIDRAIAAGEEPMPLGLDLLVLN